MKGSFSMSRCKFTCKRALSRLMLAVMVMSLALPTVFTCTASAEQTTKKYAIIEDASVGNAADKSDKSSPDGYDRIQLAGTAAVSPNAAAGSTRNGYVKFNTETAVDAAHLVSAKLFLKVFSHSNIGAGTPPIIKAYKTGSAWSEGTITYNNQVAQAPVNPTTVQAEVSLPTTTSTAIANLDSSWIQIDITNYLKTYPNDVTHSLKLTLNTALTAFYSKDNTVDTSFQPYVEAISDPNQITGVVTSKTDKLLFSEDASVKDTATTSTSPDGADKLVVSSTDAISPHSAAVANRNSYIKFNTGSPINLDNFVSAKIFLKVLSFDNIKTGTPPIITVKKTGTAWSENTITDENQTAQAPEDATAITMKYSLPTATGTTSFGGSWVELDITGLIKDFPDDITHSFKLSINTAIVQFYSKDSSTSANRPYVELVTSSIDPMVLLRDSGNNDITAKGFGSGKVSVYATAFNISQNDIAGTVVMCLYKSGELVDMTYDSKIIDLGTKTIPSSRQYELSVNVPTGEALTNYTIKVYFFDSIKGLQEFSSPIVFNPAT